MTAAAGHGRSERSPRRGRTVTPLPQRQDEMLARYTTLLAGSDLAPNTQSKYAGSVRAYLAWLAGQPRFRGADWLRASAAGGAVDAYRRQLRALGRSSSRINGTLAAVNDFHERLGVTSSRPRSEIQPVRVTVAALDRAQLTRYVGALAGRSSSRDRAIGAFPLYAGLRVSEVVLLDVGDVDLDTADGEVRVRGLRSSGDRRVPLVGPLRRELGRWRKERSAIDGPTGALFVDASGRRITEHAARRVVADLAAEAGMACGSTGFRPIHLRHSYALDRLGAGHDVATVAAWLGISVREASRTYAVPPCPGPSRSTGARTSASRR